MTFFDNEYLYEEEIEELKEGTVFTHNEVVMLFERFKMLDKHNNGFITLNELMMLPEFNSNPLSGLILNAIEDTMNYETMAFPYFFDIMQIFSTRTNQKERCRFLFKSFDMNRDGRICDKVLQQIYRLMFGENCDELKMYSEVKKVLNDYDRGVKGYLNFKDFQRFYTADKSIDELVAIDFENFYAKQKV